MVKLDEPPPDPDEPPATEGLDAASEGPRALSSTSTIDASIAPTPAPHGDADDPPARSWSPDPSSELGVADTWQASMDGPALPEPGPDPVADEVQQARAYDTLFRRAARPRQLGRYVVLDSLGQGAMGVVLRAYDRELDRTVALKVLHREIDEQHTQRLRREAQALAKLSHPHVVQVYEVGEVEGQTFVAMELVKGRTLQEWMQQRPRPSWKACVEVFVQVGSGLAAAHERGLVHRDFKPSNAIVDDEGRARVLDFGLARRDGELDEPSATLERARTDVHANVPLEASLTATGTVLGTPAYMPPEQMGGLEADARSDQFSFCVSLYEALYGERPYEGGSMMALMISMRRGAVRPAPRSSDVPLALRRVLLRGLAVNRAERWPSMEVLLEALRGLVAPRRRRWMVLGVSVGLVAIGGGLGATQTLQWLNRCTGARKQLEGVWDDARRQEVRTAILGTGLSYAPGTWERVEPRLDAYAEAWATEHTEACEATRVRDEQSEAEMSLRMACLRERSQHLRANVNELAQADATVVEHAVQAVASLPGLERCRDLTALQAEVPPPEDPAVAEQVAALDEQLVEAKAKDELGKLAEGLRLADEAVAESARLGYEPLMVRARLIEGSLREGTGDYDGAATALRSAYRAAVIRRMTIEAAEASTRLVHVLGSRLALHEEAQHWAEHAEPLSLAVGGDEAHASLLSARGSVARSRGSYDEARELYERALAIREEALEPDHPNVAASLGRLASVLHLQGKYDDARRLLERALLIRTKAMGPDHPNVAASLATLGNVAQSQGKHDEARVFLLQALAIYEKALGPDHPDVASALNSLGAVAQSQVEYDEARRSFQRALDIQVKALPPDHPHVARSLNNLAVVAETQGKYDEARALHERALAIQEKALGPDHPNVATSLDNLGIVAESQGKHDEARTLHERALAIQEKALGPDHLHVARSLNALGVVAASQGKHDEARERFERALAIREEALGPEDPELAYPLSGIGEALLGLARPAEALAPLERALAIQTTHAVNPVFLADTRFALARALWAAPRARGRDRPRARALAEQARSGYAAAGGAENANLVGVEAWLAEHRLP